MSSSQASSDAITPSPQVLAHSLGSFMQSNPVSIARQGDDLFVVGQGNHALAQHDLPSGEIVDVLMLPSEPADIVIGGLIP